MMLPITLAVPWGYTEESGPARWGGISKAHATCQASINQSSIDIQTTTASKLGLPALNVRYVDDPTGSWSINHTLQATVSSYVSNSIEIDKTLYCLKQFDFHTPSEHTLNGKTYPLELQLTHENQSRDIAIMAVMFDIGEPSQATQNLQESSPAMENSSMATFSPADIHQLLLDNKTHWRHRGSLIMPPCTEGVTWTILKTPVSLSAEQMDKFHYVVGPASNRPLQPLNERKITGGYSEDTEVLY